MKKLAEMGVTFRGYSESDGPELLKLINRGYGIARDSCYWKWKFDDNPAGRALSCIVEKDAKIVAHFGGLPVRFMVNGEVRRGVQDVDDIVDASNRTFQGVFHVNKCRTVMHREHDVDFMYGFSIEVTSKVAQTQYGYGVVTSIPRLVKVLDYRPFLNRRGTTRVFKPLGNLVSSYQRLREPRVPVVDPIVIEDVTRFDERFDRFWAQIKNDYPLMVVRDSAYLNWRFVDIPHVETARFALCDRDTRNVLGFVVVSENRDGLPRGRILDLVTRRSESGSRHAASLIERAIEHFRSRQIVLAVGWALPHCHVRKPLESAGFRPRLDQIRDVMFRNVELNDPAIATDLALDESNWFLSIGDSDMS